MLSLHLPHVGRVALPADGGPLILPVNYRVADGCVVFRAGPGSKLAAAAQGLDVGFEAELTRLHRLPLRPRAGGQGPHSIRSCRHRSAAAGSLDRPGPVRGGQSGHRPRA